MMVITSGLFLMTFHSPDLIIITRFFIWQAFQKSSILSVIRFICSFFLHLTITFIYHSNSYFVLRSVLNRQINKKWRFSLVDLKFESFKEEKIFYYLKTGNTGTFLLDVEIFLLDINFVCVPRVLKSSQYIKSISYLVSSQVSVYAIFTPFKIIIEMFFKWSSKQFAFFVTIFLLEWTKREHYSF